MVERFAFYERAKNAFAVVATSESAFICKYHSEKGRGRLIELMMHS